MLTNKITILLFNEYSLICEGVISYFKKNERIDLKVINSSNQFSFDKIVCPAPDIVMLDIKTERWKFLTSKKKFEEHFPNSNLLILSMMATPQRAFRTLLLGASGYILPSISKDEFIKAIKVVAGGGEYFSPGISELIGSQKLKTGPVNSLTEREKSILIAVTHGKSSKVIAHEFNISVRTVETHRSNIKRKINVTSVVDMVIYAIENNLVKMQYCSNA